MAHTLTQDNVILSSLRYSGRLFIPNGNTTPELAETANVREHVRVTISSRARLSQIYRPAFSGSTNQHWIQISLARVLASKTPHIWQHLMKGLRSRFQVNHHACRLTRGTHF